MTTATPDLGITPEKQASMPQYLYRQFFQRATPLTKKNADMRGKTAIVTGSNVGLGLHAATWLVNLGVDKLILAVRNLDKGEAARGKLKAIGKTDIEVWQLDLDSYDSVIQFAERAKSLARLDVAILNAGIYKAKQEFHPTSGIEIGIQVNYISTALLSILLLPALSKGDGPGRLTVVSSDMAAWVPFPERSSDPILSEFKKEKPKWSHQQAYGTSKLLGQLFITELANRVPSSKVTINLVHPGFCYDSDLQREGNGTWEGFMFRCAVRIIGRAPKHGALAIVYAATQFGQTSHGQLGEDDKLRPKAPFLYSPEAAKVIERLWKETMDEFLFAGVESIVSSIANESF